MTKNRLLLIYISLVATLILILNFLSLRGLSDNYLKLESKLDEVNKQLEKKLISESTAPSPTPTPVPVATSAAALGVSKEPEGGYITINDAKWEDVSIYEDKSYSSKIISNAEFGKAYRYTKKEPNWYLISLIAEEKTG